MNRDDGAVPLTTFRLAAAGVGLQVTEAGEGPPLLLLHGFPDSADLWRPMCKLLAHRFRVWMPDLRGYRESDKPEPVQAYTITTLLEDVDALVHAMVGRDGKVALAGHDWGGMLAWAFAATRPAQVEKLVVLNAPHPVRFAELLREDAAQREASAYLFRLAAPHAAAVLWAANLAALRGGLQHELPSLAAEELQAIEHGWRVPGALEAMLRWYQALDLHLALQSRARSIPSLGQASGRIDAPTLLLWGERDGSFVADNLLGLERWVPQLQIRRFPDGGHWLPRQRPEEIAREIAGFLGSPP